MTDFVLSPFSFIQMWKPLTAGIKKRKELLVLLVLISLRPMTVTLCNQFIVTYGNGGHIEEKSAFANDLKGLILMFLFYFLHH